MTEDTATRAAPVSAPPGATPVMRSPIHALHTTLGARFSLEGGWEIPADYRSLHEDLYLNEAVGVCDITARGKVDVRGAIDPVLSGADGLTARISDVWALFLTTPGGEKEMLPDLGSRAGSGAMVTDATHLYAGFALAGPALPDLFAQVTGFDVSTVEKGSSAGAPIAQVRSVLLRRDLPRDPVEVYVGSDSGRFVWETLLDVARALGGGPVGWDALRAWGWSA